MASKMCGTISLTPTQPVRKDTTPHRCSQTAQVSQTRRSRRAERMSEDAKFILGFG
jgi:hypothetical protein